MKTKERTEDKVNIVTLGCAKNLVDSEVMLTQLRGSQIKAEHESIDNDSNIVVINTCGFIENAKQESIETILKYAAAKERGLIKKLYVTGCLSQRYRDELAREIPSVDGYFGTGSLKELLARFNADYKHELLGERLTTTDAHYSYLKIAEGCDRPCSFCAIPLMRGRHVSRPIEALVREARHLARTGTKELLLIAQDSTYYGLDLYRKRKLAELLERLAEVEGIEWIRLHYAFPTGFPEDILEVMNSRPTICKYLDIPLQHGSTAMLRRMRRGTTRAQITELIARIRQQVPGIALRTTLIAGHPGETEAEFEEMLSFVEESRFDRLGVFAYSHEEGTHAYTMPDDVPEAVKQERLEMLMAVQQGISMELNEAKIGSRQKVLIDRKERDFFYGRTEADSPEVDNEVLIDAKENCLRIGDFVSVEITGAEAFDLYAKPIQSNMN